MERKAFSIYSERRQTIYELRGVMNRAGSASIAEIAPGVWSILIGQLSTRAVSER